MKRLFLYTVKRTLTSPALLGWGILFALFWGVIAAFVGAPSFISQLSSFHLPSAIEHTEYLYYASGWYADLVILSLSAIATSVAVTLSYQTGTLPYLIRYSKLKTSTYFTSMYSGSLIASLILELLFTAIITLMFSYNGVGITVTPSNIGIIILAIILGSIFIISFATFLNLIMIKIHAYRLQNLFNYIPLIIGFLFYAIFAFAPPTKSSMFYYSNPYMSGIVLLYKGYTGSFKLLFSANNEVPIHLSLGLLSLSIVAWVVALNVINLVLVRKISYANIEEGRTM